MELFDEIVLFLLRNSLFLFAEVYGFPDTLCMDRLKTSLEAVFEFF
jgi:hypothetical protein